MNKFKKIILAALTFFALVLPQIAFAAANSNVANTGSGSAPCSTLEKQFANAGGSSLVADIPKYCNVESLYLKVINGAMLAAGVVAVIAIIYGGYMYMTARGNDAQVKQGRTILTWAIIGLIVVIVAATLVNIVVRALVENSVV